MDRVRNHRLEEEPEKILGRKKEKADETDYRAEFNETTRAKRAEICFKSIHIILHSILLIYIPPLLLLLISFRWISITAITAQYSSNAL